MAITKTALSNTGESSMMRDADYTDLLYLKKQYVLKLEELNPAQADLEAKTKDEAEKECLYREAKSKAFVNLLAEGEKVTVIATLADGRISKVRMEYKVAKGMLKASNQNIKRIHSGIEAWRTLISVAKSEINIR